MKAASRRWTPATVALSAVALLVGGVLYSRGVRRVALGNEFRYIPRESELVFATGSVATLWEGGRRLVVAGLAAAKEHPPWADFLRDVLSDVKPIHDADELGHYGLDVHRGLLVAVQRPTAGGGFVAVVPVLGERAVLAGLAKLKVSPTKPALLPAKAGEPVVSSPVYEAEDMWFAFPEPDLAVVASSVQLLRRSLALREQNLAHAANNDSLYHAIKRVARGPLMADSTVFAYWQSRTAPFDERSALLRFAADGLHVSGEIELAGGSLRVVDDLRRRSWGDAGWMDNLPARTLALAVLRDDRLAHYESFVIEELLGLPVAGTGAQPRPIDVKVRFPAVDQVALAVTDLRDGVPDVLMGVWGRQPELEAFLAYLQQGYRDWRDRPLLDAALAEYQRGGGTKPTLAELERLGLLAPERDSLFHRYPLSLDRAGDPEFQPQDFATPAYERNLAGHLIRFIVPPLGENDRRYRGELADARPQGLDGDRYRLATTFHQGALWVATNVADLEALLAAKPAGGDRGSRSAVLAPMPPDAKFHAVIDAERLVTLSLLASGSGSDEIDNIRHMVAAGLRGVQLVEIDALTSRDETGLRLSARLTNGAFR